MAVSYSFYPGVIRVRITRNFLPEVKELVRSAQYAALNAVNTGLMGLYRDIGRMICRAAGRRKVGKGSSPTTGGSYSEARAKATRRKSTQSCARTLSKSNVIEVCMPDVTFAVAQVEGVL